MRVLILSFIFAFNSNLYAGETQIVIWGNYTDSISIILNEQYHEKSLAISRLEEFFDSFDSISSLYCKNPIKSSAIYHGPISEYNDDIPTLFYKYFHFIAYVGNLIDTGKIHKCTEFIYKNGLYIKSKTPEYEAKLINDSILYILYSEDFFVKSKTTQLVDGEWFAYFLNCEDQKTLKNRALSISNGKINGYLKYYNRLGNIRNIEKYINGQLVDSILDFNESGEMYSVKVMSSDGLEIYKNLYYFTNSKQLYSYTDYQLGFRIAFFEDGSLKSFVQIKELNKWGEELIFDENGNIVARIKY